MIGSGDNHDRDAVPAGWEGILDPDERILWQGRPDPGFSMALGNLFPLLFGIFFAGFALFWMTMAARGGGGFWMFGLIHFAVGAAMALHALLGDTWRRRHTWYTLTDRRAFVATALPLTRRKLTHHMLDRHTVLELEASNPGTVWFGYRPGGNGSRRRVGFERIENAVEVHRLMRKVALRAVPETGQGTGELA